MRPSNIVSLILLTIAIAVLPQAISAQEADSKKPEPQRRGAFKQLEDQLPTPNDYRTASGAPGHKYWQQKVDYKIHVEINDENQHLTGSETIDYTNNSPDTLTYLWVQIDPNIYRPDAQGHQARTAPNLKETSYARYRAMLARNKFNGGANITRVADANGKDLSHTINNTMMRIDLESPLKSGQSTRVQIDWDYAINNSKLVRGRTGYEHFEEDDNCIYEIAQWFPRLAVYSDAHGWQNKQFLGRGEFTLEFGDYDVSITVPADHIVASTGELQNASEVLSKTQLNRFEEAKIAKKPQFIVTPNEAKEAQKSKSDQKKTWRFKAKNVRDFAFASSRKFIWDAQGHKVGDRVVMAMSYFPNEGEPLWSRYSTHAIIHTLDVYSRFTIDYPYPVAISVNGPVYGMEYPMICFNGPRPEKDGTYSKRTKYGLISVIIHEVGHNYFPMIINSDERRWTWMDEGLNTFVQFLAQNEWEENYPSRRGEARDIVDYMKSSNQVPIMTHSEQILQFGANAYSKPATALNILRETVMGRELFDFAFKEYSKRWAFKRPMPADFFRSMEDASAVDLDWFWRGWFYTTKHTDLAITKLEHIKMDTGDPSIDKAALKEERDSKPKSITKQRNKGIAQRVDAFPELIDFYNSYDEFDVTPKDHEKYADLIAGLEDWQFELLQTHNNFYILHLENIGGLVMPIILDIEYASGKHEEVRLPAEIWQKDNLNISKLFLTKEEIRSIVLDPHLETADTELSNNYFPQRPQLSRFKLFKKKKKDKNPIQEHIGDQDKNNSKKTDAEEEPAAGEARKL